MIRLLKWFVLPFCSLLIAAVFVTPAAAGRCDDEAPENGYMDRGVCVPGVISAETWWTAAPQYIVGKAVFYAPNVMEGTARYRNMSLDGFMGGVAMMSAADIGEVVWLKRPGSNWEGPYLVVDTSQRNHMWVNVVHIGEVVEVDFETARRWGMADYANNAEGYDVFEWMIREVEVWKSLTPPDSVHDTMFRASVKSAAPSGLRVLASSNLIVEPVEPVRYAEWFSDTVTYTNNVEASIYPYGHGVQKFPDMETGTLYDEDGNILRQDAPAGGTGDGLGLLYRIPASAAFLILNL